MKHMLSFSQKGIKVIVKSLGSLYKFTLLDQDKGQVYESQDKQFKRISQQTITAAFDPKNKNVQYDLLKMSETTLKINIIVKLDFLPEFSEDIELKKTETDKSQLNKIQEIQLMRQIDLVDRMISEQQKLVNFVYTEEKGNYYSLQGKELNKVKLLKGSYMINCSGSVITSAMYNGQYDDEGYDQYGNGGVYGNSNHKLICSILIDNKQIQRKCQKPHMYDCYDYPYNYGFKITLEKDSEVVVNLELQTAENITMGQSVIEITPISQFY